MAASLAQEGGHRWRDKEEDKGRERLLRTRGGRGNLGGEDGDEGDHVPPQNRVRVQLRAVRRRDAEQRVRAAAEQPHGGVRRAFLAAVGGPGGVAVGPGRAGDVLAGLDVEQLEGLAVQYLPARPCSGFSSRAEMDVQEVARVVRGGEPASL
jgi:hypothetical protein